MFFSIMLVELDIRLPDPIVHNFTLNCTPSTLKVKRKFLCVIGANISNYAQSMQPVYIDYGDSTNQSISIINPFCMYILFYVIEFKFLL